MNNNQQSSQSAEERQHYDTKFILLIINQVVLWALIIVYVALSQSIFSTLSLLFMIISVVFTISTPYYLQKDSSSSNSISNCAIKPYPVNKIIWICFTIVNFISLSAKIIIYFTQASENMSKSLKTFLQVQSLEAVFLPIILIPFGIAAIFLKIKDKKLSEFKIKMHNFLPLPLYLSLSLIIILIQIFSVSIAGLLYFFIMIYLFWMKSFNLKDIYSKVLLLVLQTYTTIIIILTYLAQCEYFKSNSAINYFQFFGINSLNQFQQNLQSRGHFICQILLSLLVACLNRLFIYQSFNSVYNEMKHSNKIQIADIEAMSQNSSETDRKIINDVPQIIPTRSLTGKKAELNEFLLNKKRISQKVHSQRQQIQMKDLSQKLRDSIHSDNYGQPIKSQQKQKRQEMFFEEILKFQDEAVDEQEIQKTNRLNKQKQKQNQSKQMKKKVINIIYSIFSFFNSPNFALRIIEIISIIVIQRYNNIYSFVNLIWLFIVASSQNWKIIRIITAFIIIPLQIGNFTITYLYNIPQSPVNNIANAEIFGFQTFSNVWLDVIIFNIYLNYLILFIKSYQKLNINQKNIKTIKRKPKLWETIVAFIFRYTYVITLIGIFFLGFSNPTLMNICFVIIFLVFFSNGDNLIFIKKKKKKKQKISLTTFSKNYWFIIVYFTLICIILKYIYFLFFSDKLTQWFQPTGINEKYDWSFNFSLSSVCQSNTTPLFIIFVLTQIQIIIYRSYIYTHFSFSLMADFTNGISNEIYLNQQSKRKLRFKNFVIALNEFYYQTIYYISGIIIIGCSYRWSFIGFAIIILTCIGLLKNFNKKLLGLILFLNLTFLFTNYFLILLNHYPIISQTTGQPFINIVNKIALFIGFSLAKNSYASVFILNIVIFYFCVLCYGISNVLATPEFNQINQHSNSSRPKRTINHESFQQQTIINSEYDDDNFAQNYKKDVIQSTKRFYNQDLIAKYKGVRLLGKLSQMMLTNIVSIFVILECLYFRLSISMFFFLLIYLIYYFKFFDMVGQTYQRSNFNNIVQQILQKFIQKEKLLKNQQQFRKFSYDKQELQKTQSYIKDKADTINFLKSNARKVIWKFSASLTVACLLLTYLAQFLTSQFYTQYIIYSQTNLINVVLYIIGVSAGDSFANYVYFYYIMLIINICEKLTIAFSQKIRLHDIQKSSQIKVTIRQLPRLQNPNYLIDAHVTQHFILNISGQDNLVTQPQHSLHLIPSNMQRQNEKEYLQDKQCYEEANLLIYFQFKVSTIRINFLYGCVHVVIRFYLWLMLINVYTKSNIFAFAYLFTVIFFWFKEVNFGLIKNINKAAISLLLIQYFVLLLDINTITSPLPLPVQDLSMLEYFINNPALVDFLAISSSTSDNYNFLGSFIINSIIIFLTQICFTVFQLLSQQMVKSILLLYLKYQNILFKLKNISETDPIIVNIQNFKSLFHRFITFSYENIIMNSYLLVSLLIFILLSGVDSIIAILLLIIAFLYIYIGIFTKISQKDDIFKYTRYYFRFFNILQFIIILLSIILSIPFLQNQTGTTVIIASQFASLKSLQQIFLILFIQLWLDLNSSKSFTQTSQIYRKQEQQRSQIFLRCQAFQKNNQLISELIKQFKEVLSFDNSIASAMNIIKQWHSCTNKDVKVLQYQFEMVNNNKFTTIIRKQIQQEQIANDHKEFKKIFSNFVIQQTDIALSEKYYGILKYIVKNINGIVFRNEIKISAWSFIKQDYGKLSNLVEDFDTDMKEIVNYIINSDEDENIQTTLQNLLKEQKIQQSKKQQLKIQLTTPAKLKIDAQTNYQKQHKNINILAAILSNIDIFILLLIEIYYLLNPCLLSFPLLAFVFCYNMIATTKYTTLLIIYIFLLIILAQFFQYFQLALELQGRAVIKFLYYLDPNSTTSANFQLGYLYFLFIIVFMNQQITKYQGKKFKDYPEVQNLEQAFLRILVNESEESKLNLWKYSHVQHDFLDNINPFNLAAFDIDSNLQNLMYNQSSFKYIFSDRKQGIDVYPGIATVQIFITIYLIFFYSYMTSQNAFTLQQSTKYFQFSSDMVIGVLVHVVNMVIERYITVLTISRRKKNIIKYIYTVIIFCLFSWFIFYLAPYKATVAFTSSIYAPNSALLAFSFFYFFYFYLSALQIKYGYKQFKSFNSLMTRRGYTNYYILSLYTVIPFLYEIKIIMDWTFSYTSLTMFDWFRTFSIYLRAFNSKINYYNATTTTILGKTIPFYYKIIGWAGFIIILIIIFGPMVLFSGLNPAAETNLIVSGAMAVSLQIIGGNSFTLYTTSHFSVPPLAYNQSLFQAQNFYNIPVLQQINTNDIPQQFQNINFQQFSDQNWGISSPNYLALIQTLNNTIQGMKAGNTSVNNFQLSVTYQLKRQIVSIVAQDTSFNYPNNGFLNLTQLQQLYATFTNCNSPTFLQNFYISLLRLSTIGNSYKPRPIIFTNQSSYGTQYQPYLFNATLNLLCSAGSSPINNTNNAYWGLYMGESINASNANGLSFYVFCDKYQNIIGGYGFTALYTSIILVVAGFVRSMFDGNLPLIPYQMNPKPDNILQICQAINTLRVRKQYRQEYLMYYELIDIIRSPQIMKHLSGSYPYLIQKAHEQDVRKNESKQSEKRKTL